MAIMVTIITKLNKTYLFFTFTLIRIRVNNKYTKDFGALTTYRGIFFLVVEVKKALND